MAGDGKNQRCQSGGKLGRTAGDRAEKNMEKGHHGKSQEAACSKAVIFKEAMAASLQKFSPFYQVHNPVLFLVWVSFLVTAGILISSLIRGRGENGWFVFAVAVLLFLQIFVGNLAESAAQAETAVQARILRRRRGDGRTVRIPSVNEKDKICLVPVSELEKGDLIYVTEGEVIPADGCVAEGTATVDESAVTGESAPVIREKDSSRDRVAGGTTVMSDWLVIEVDDNPGEGLLERMITLTEGASQKRTSNEKALLAFLSALSVVFLFVCLSLYCYFRYFSGQRGELMPAGIVSFIALFVCLTPTTAGALLSCVRIGGIKRLSEANVLAMDGRALETAGSVDVLMLDKTGTITLGDRQAAAFYPVDGTDPLELGDAAQLSSLADETLEGRSIVVLAKEKFGLRGRNLEELKAHYVPFTHTSRMSGIDFKDNEIRKGAADAVKVYVESAGGIVSEECQSVVREIAGRGATPLVVAKNRRVLGVIELKDMMKEGIAERFADFRSMGIKSIMLTGDNSLTAATVAAEAGVDDFQAEASPEVKLAMVKEYQAKGHLVAMTGAGRSDGPALAQADVALAMNNSVSEVRDACNMIDLDSNPTKLIEVVKIGKQILMTRGALTVLGIANGLAAYFVIFPAMIRQMFPGPFDFLKIGSVETGVLSALIFQVLMTAALYPLAVRGVRYRNVPSSRLLLDNLLTYGLGGFILPLLAMKLIDMILGILGIK